MNTTRRVFLGSAALAAGGLAASHSPAAQDDDPSKLGKTPHTKFAVNVEMWWAKAKLPFLQRLHETAKLGFPAVEFWPWRRNDVSVDAIAEECQKFNLAVAQFTAWGFKPGLNDPANHNKFVDEIEASCAVAKKLNCKLMTVVGGDDIAGMTRQQMHDYIITGLKKAAPVAEKHGVTLILEPMNVRVDHKGHCLYGSAPAVRICKEVGSKFVKINWDLYHMHISEGDLCGHLKEGYEYVGYVQVADHPGRNEPGTGEIHYPRVLRQLHELGYRGYVGLECRPLKSELEAARAVNRADQW
jgi:hydroxypyruvate isomerase